MLPRLPAARITRRPTTRALFAAVEVRVHDLPAAVGPGTDVAHQTARPHFGAEGLGSSQVGEVHTVLGAMVAAVLALGAELAGRRGPRLGPCSRSQLMAMGGSSARRPRLAAARWKASRLGIVEGGRKALGPHVPGHPVVVGRQRVEVEGGRPAWIVEDPGPGPVQDAGVDQAAPRRHRRRWPWRCPSGSRGRRARGPGACVAPATAGRRCRPRPGGSPRVGSGGRARGRPPGGRPRRGARR